MQSIQATLTTPHSRSEPGFPLTAAATASQPEHDLATLVPGLTQGDQHAFTKLFDATRKQVYSLILRIVRDATIAEDVMIEAYTQFYRQATDYNPSKGTPTAWLLTLARCRAIDRLRGDTLRRIRESTLGSATCVAPPPDPEMQSAAREQQHMVRQTLATLDPKQRQALEMAYYDGLSHREIASRLGKPLGTVKTRIRLGLKALKGRLYPPVGAEEKDRTRLPMSDRVAELYFAYAEQ